MSVEQLVAASGYAERTVRGALKKLEVTAHETGTHAPNLWSLDEEQAA
jgi:hypothetical protein